MKTISLGLFLALAGSCAAFETNRPVSVSPFGMMDLGHLAQSNRVMEALRPQSMGGLGAAFQRPASPLAEGLRSGPSAGGSRYPMLMGDANPAVDRGMVHRADAGIDVAMIHSPDPARRGLVKVKPAPERAKSFPDR